MIHIRHRRRGVVVAGTIDRLQFLLGLATLLFSGCSEKPGLSPYEAYNESLEKTDIQLPIILASSSGFSAESLACIDAARTGMATRLKVAFVADAPHDLPRAVLVSLFRANGGGSQRKFAVTTFATLVAIEGNHGEASVLSTTSLSPGEYEIEILDTTKRPGRSVRIGLNVIP